MSPLRRGTAATNRRNTIDKITENEYKNRLRSGALSVIDYKIFNLLESSEATNHGYKETIFEQEKE